MILPDFVIPSKINYCSDYLSPDTVKANIKFLSYPWKVDYQFNSRGYRDREWPDTIQQLSKCIWCFGCSFTVGIGSPIDHIWPRVLESTTNTRTINVSMSGASNNFILRKSLKVIEEISPRLVVLNWTYAHRAELENSDGLDDEARNIDFRKLAVRMSPDKLANQMVEQIQTVELLKKDTKVIHMLLQDFADFDVVKLVTDSLKQKNIDFIHQKQLDFSRDNYHWDIKTSQWIVQQVTKMMHSKSIVL